MLQSCNRAAVSIAVFSNEFIYSNLPSEARWLRERQRTSPPPAASFCLPPDYWCRCIRPRNLCSSLLPKTWAPSGTEPSPSFRPRRFPRLLGSFLELRFFCFRSCSFFFGRSSRSHCLTLPRTPIFFIVHLYLVDGFDLQHLQVTCNLVVR